MNGGVLDMVQQLPPEDLAAAVSGYQFFGLGRAGEVLEFVRDQLGEQDLLPGDAERLEIEADKRYADVLPDDRTLVRAFEARYVARPDLFAPSE
jgi:hypothetical protein